ncbi:hypothetical protein PTSG_11234 [Salpingoeca rosetta]|uniref:Apple domain-containing protein n=1 Tax=Salpingoeca rosetta (strain ATCC 50818 / BSB-021) TaxID=946362 RepID=F2UST9_SALR5|nr:uncharacterized protein PTSG_11234 [Salpingoeca rosetta]XP_012493102.1 hypothetical protein, variant [Salpingoeca rosetta]EGD81198.1 hypothetical protein, variant [Salpingoeca rosetta]EGD81199.1 hypothetical protein PTSG_11234 [Salpingoeca rosetta]|eukprot:XP_004987733.1 hypothetical protein PTSG_11234 [Salpingoeca rosetta]
MNKAGFSLLLIGLIAAFSGGVRGQYAACSLLQVSDAASCLGVCQSVYTTNSYAFYDRSGSKTCVCTVGEDNSFQVCGSADTTTTTTTAATTTTTDYFESDPTLTEARAYLTTLLGSNCESAVSRALTAESLQCIELFVSAEDDVFSPGVNQTLNEFYDDMCRAPCLGVIFNAIDKLEAAGCLPDVADNAPTTPLNATLATLDQFATTRDDVHLKCVRVDGSATPRYCGAILPTVTKFETAAHTVTADDCTEVMEHGYCLGNILQVSWEGDVVEA